MPKISNNNVQPISHFGYTDSNSGTPTFPVSRVYNTSKTIADMVVSNMHSRLYQHKNVVIETKGDGAKKAVIFAHGGFTPERGLFRKGSGITVLPNSTTLHFNAKHGSPSIGLKGGYMLQNGGSIEPLDVCLPGSTITNYSLTFNAKFEPFEPSSEYDVIKISPQGKAHMTDVFDALKIHGLMYEQIHSFACRIDKSTWAGTRLIGSPILHEK